MGKNDFLSPKAIGNRIKSKGLQKLRWYCEMCQKQCRDENGFKCHQTSESHLRQMQVFGLNPTRVIDGYSEEFEKSFLLLLSMSHRNSRVAAQVVYNEYIGDKQHIHMNGAQLYKPVDQEEALRDQLSDKRKRAEETEEARQDRMIEEQRQRAKMLRREAGGEESEEEAAPTDLVREGDAPISIALGFVKKEDPSAARAARAAKAESASAAEVKDDPRNEEARRRLREETARREADKKKPDYIRIAEEDMRRKKERERADAERAAAEKAAAAAAAGGSKNAAPPWLEKGLVVKVMSAKLKREGYYKQKGLVVRVIDGFIGELSMLGEFAGDIVRVDQAELETVLPAIGGEVRVLAVAPEREARGCTAKLLELDIDRYKATVEVTGGGGAGAEKGRVLCLDYEHVCKLQR